jgi:hypothetical protein
MYVAYKDTYKGTYKGTYKDAYKDKYAALKTEGVRYVRRI